MWCRMNEKSNDYEPQAVYRFDGKIFGRRTRTGGFAWADGWSQERLDREVSSPPLRVRFTGRNSEPIEIKGVRSIRFLPDGPIDAGEDATPLDSPTSST